MKAPRLKVYGCTRHRSECPGAQTREVVAATSKAAARRAFEAIGANMRGVELGETGNDVEVTSCLAEPGVVFWRPSASRGPSRRYVRHGESWTGRPIWIDRRHTGARAERHSVRLSHGYVDRVRGTMASVRLEESLVEESTNGADPTLMAEALARRVVRARIAELQAALEWLGPEPEAEPTPKGGA